MTVDAPGSKQVDRQPEFVPSIRYLLRDFFVAVAPKVTSVSKFVRPLFQDEAFDPELSKLGIS